ncbi:hypothetical protein, partial [Neomoorella thermoacetica]|uniref:hypothetical protein n=1 Tax=Neomoorella thermoacetica TaxID=1525 RepID=UPI001C4364D8
LDALPFVHADHLFFLPLSGEILSQGGSVLFDDLGSILFYDLHPVAVLEEGFAVLDVRMIIEG